MAICIVSTLPWGQLLVRLLQKLELLLLLQLGMYIRVLSIIS